MSMIEIGVLPGGGVQHAACVVSLAPCAGGMRWVGGYLVVVVHDAYVFCIDCACDAGGARAAGRGSPTTWPLLQFVVFIDHAGRPGNIPFL